MNFFSEPYAMSTLFEYCQKADIPPTNIAELRWRCYSMLGPTASRFRARAIQYVKSWGTVRLLSLFLRTEALIWIRWSIKTVQHHLKQLCRKRLWWSFQCERTMIPSYGLKTRWDNETVNKLATRTSPLCSFLDHQWPSLMVENAELISCWCTFFS